MNVSIRRQGITIRTVPVNGERARVGNGADCEIQLNDQFLAPVVAEFVRRGGEWHLVDSGKSLEGITKRGVRVVDEPVEPDEPYLVGAFELVTDANAMRRPLTRAGAAPADEYIPMTMVESGGAFPKTVVEPNAKPPASRAAASPAAQKIQFAPVAAGSPAHAAPKRAAAGSNVQKRRILLVALVALATVVVGLVIVTRTGTRTRPPVPAPTETASRTPTTPAPAAVAANGDELAQRLEVEKAFAAWEAEASAKPNASPELQRKIAGGAFELARAYSAANDFANAKRYFEKVVRYGDPESEQVRYSRTKLEAR